MEEEKALEYEVVVTQPAEFKFYELLEYLFDVYPFERAEQIANELRNTTKTLQFLPHRGVEEPFLTHLKRKFRFILFSRTDRAEIKIIYFIDEERKTVFVTDFFPTEKDRSRLVK
jgi:mRNA-degrading endonuclease RelE of RelBE toxin-antitoxin system